MPNAAVQKLSKYVLPLGALPSVSANNILNQSVQQVGANFDIDGNGVIAGGLAVGKDIAVGQNLVLSSQNGNALATNATNQFLYATNMAGKPTGTPSFVSSGSLPLVIDTTNKKIWTRIANVWTEVAAAGLTWINAASISPIGVGTSVSPYEGWDSAINWAASNQVIYFPQRNNAPTYYHSLFPISISGGSTYLVGDSPQGSILRFNVVTPQTFFTFTTGINQEYNYGGMSNLAFESTDTTNKKVFCKLVDCGQMSFYQVYSITGAWTGNNSIGFQVQGREKLTWDKCLITADTPFSIEVDPNGVASGISFDSCSITRTQTLCNSTTVGTHIAVASGVFMSSSRFSDMNWVSGKDGFKFVDTTGATTWFDVIFDNIRSEAGTSATAAFITMTSTVIGFQAIVVKNCYVSGNTASSGIVATSWQWGEIDNFYFTPPTGVALNFSSTCTDLTIIGGYKAATASNSINASVKYNAIGHSTTAALVPTKFTPSVIIGGALSTNAGANFALANARNDNIAVGATSFVQLTSGGASATISGISGGTDGLRLCFVNGTGSVIGILYQDVNSSAANRIYTDGGVTKNIGNAGSAELIYLAALSGWFLITPR